MAGNNADPTPITPPRVPFIDERTGLIDRAWYMFFLSLFKAAQAAMDELLEPNSITLAALLDEALRRLAQELQTLPTSVLEQAQPFLNQIAQKLDTLPVSATPDQIAQLTNDVQALAVAPAYTPQLRNRAYGTFYDTTTQTVAVINTAYPITLNSTVLSNGVFIGSPTSRVYFTKDGVYNLQFSAQLDNTSGGNHLVFIWLRVNGVNVPYSAGQVRLKGTDGELVTSWNYVEQLRAGDYCELMWSADDTAVQILSQAAVAPVPAIPSVILTVTDNISPYQD